MDKTSVTLSWKPPKDDGGSPLTEYVFERRESTRTTWTKVASIPPDELTYEATELNETINYYFRVSAKNKHGVSSPLETESTVRPKSKFGKNGKSVLWIFLYFYGVICLMHVLCGFHNASFSEIVSLSQRNHSKLKTVKSILSTFNNHAGDVGLV